MALWEQVNVKYNKLFHSSLYVYSFVLPNYEYMCNVYVCICLYKKCSYLDLNNFTTLWANFGRQQIDIFFLIGPRK